MTPNLTDRPFAARVAASHPELWRLFLLAIEREKREVKR